MGQGLLAYNTAASSWRANLCCAGPGLTQAEVEEVPRVEEEAKEEPVDLSSEGTPPCALLGILKKVEVCKWLPNAAAAPPDWQLARQATQTPISLPSSGGESNNASISSYITALAQRNRERRRREAEVRRFLQEHGFSDVNEPRPASWWRLTRPQCPLQVAVQQGDARMARLLVLSGADPALASSASWLRRRDSAQQQAARKAADAATRGSHRQQAVALKSSSPAKSALQVEKGTPVPSTSSAGTSDWDKFFTTLKRDPLLQTADSAAGRKQ